MSDDILQTIMYGLWFIAIILELKSIRHILEEINEKLRMPESEDEE